MVNLQTAFHNSLVLVVLPHSFSFTLPLTFLSEFNPLSQVLLYFCITLYSVSSFLEDPILLADLLLAT